MMYMFQNRSTYFVLNEVNHPVPVTFEYFSRWMVEHRHRAQLAYTEVGTRAISTVFLGVNRSMSELALFETMITGFQNRGIVETYATYAEATEGHTRWVAQIQKIVESNTN